jgi:hypothetical protein
MRRKDKTSCQPSRSQDSRRCSTTRDNRVQRREAVGAAIRICWRDSDRQIARREGVAPTTVDKRGKILEKRGEILPSVKNGHSIQPCLYEVSISAIDPAPENDTLYDPIRLDDPAFLELRRQIKSQGMIDPIVVSRDGYIISGHGRYKVAELLGWSKVKVRVLPDVSYEGDPDQFMQLLVSANTLRVKTTQEAVREGVVGMGDYAWQRICDYREGAARVDGVQVVELVGAKKRSAITQKLSLRKAIEDTVYTNESDWPLSDRKVFHLLLNVQGLLRNDVRGTPFANNDGSYNDVTDMLTRMRLDGSIPLDAIGDETRPVIQWDTHRSIGTFVQRSLKNLFSGYRRDLLQSQPNWIELLVEKNTVASSLRHIASKYTVPMTSGRGYSSLPPREAMVDRFRASGREKLIVIVVSDHGPEGEDIPNSFGVSLRDDSGLAPDQLVVVKAALTREQATRLGLHEGQFAKEDLSRFPRFAERYGNRCWELEAVPTDTLREIVENAIRSVLDLEAFDTELEKEASEQDELDEYRALVKLALSDIDLSHDDGA